ncbi:MAG TPA: type II secretion system F family protein [Acidobacteriaceae bacterium]|jgi:tight adherence protein B
MLLIVVLVFVAVFIVLALVLFAGGAGASQQAKLARANLETALASRSRSTSDQIVDVRKSELLSAVPLMNRWLLQLEIAPRLRTLLHQANLQWTVGRLLTISAICLIVPAYFVYMRTGAVPIALIIGCGAAYLPFALVLQRRSARFNKFEQALPEALDLMVSALRAGHSLVAALRLVAYESADPIGGEFRICFDEQNYGLELRTAMENLVTRVPLQDLRIVSTAILIQKESGGNLAEVLDKASYLIRERFKLKRQIRVHTAQGRLTGWILTILPFALGVGLYLISPDTMSILWTRKIGIELMYLSGAMTVAGALIIRKIVNMKV